MAESVNPYKDWLNLSIEGGKPNFYELLGVRLFESDENRIRDAFRERHQLVDPYKVGPYEDRAQLLVDELSEAYKCLTSDAAKRLYDHELRLRNQDRDTTSDESGQTKVVDSASTSAASGIPAGSLIERQADEREEVSPSIPSARIVEPLVPPTDAKTTRVDGPQIAEGAQSNSGGISPPPKDAFGPAVASHAGAIRNSVQLAIAPGVQVIWAIEMGEEGLNALCISSRSLQDMEVVTYVRLDYSTARNNQFGDAQVRESTLQSFLESYCVPGCQIAVAVNLASAELRWIPIPNGFPPEVSLSEFVAQRLHLDPTASFQFEVLSVAGARGATWPNAARVAAAVSIDDPSAQQLLRLLESLDREPVVVQVGSAALLNLAVREQWNDNAHGRRTPEGEFEVVGFLTISQTFTRLVLTDGCHTWQKTISFGGEQLLKRLQAGGAIHTIDSHPWVRQIPRDVDPELLRRELKTDLDQLAIKLRQFIDRVRREVKTKIIGIRALGDASLLPWLHAHLTDRCGCPIGECGEFKRLTYSPGSIEQLPFANRVGYFSICYGVGLQAVGRSRLTVNLGHADDKPASSMLRRMSQMIGRAQGETSVRRSSNDHSRSFSLSIAAIGAAICLIGSALLLLSFRQSSEEIGSTEERSAATRGAATSAAPLAEADGHIGLEEEPPQESLPGAIQEAKQATLRTAPFMGLLIGGIPDESASPTIFAQEELPDVESGGGRGRERHAFFLTDIEPRSYVLSVYGCEGAEVSMSYSRPGAEVIVSVDIEGNLHECCRLYADGTRLVGELIPLDEPYADRSRASLSACVLEVRDDLDNSARLIALYRPKEYRVTVGEQTQRVNLSGWPIPFESNELYLAAGQIQSSTGNAFPFGQNWDSASPLRKWSLADYAQESNLAAADIELQSSATSVELVVLQEKREFDTSELTSTYREALVRIDKLDRWEPKVLKSANDGRWVGELRLLAELLGQAAPDPPPDPTPSPREQDFKHVPVGEFRPQLDRAAFARAKRAYNRERNNRLELERGLKEKAEHLVEASRRERMKLEQTVQDAHRELQSLAAKAGNVKSWRKLEATLYRLIQVRKRQVRIPIGKVIASRLDGGENTTQAP